MKLITFPFNVISSEIIDLILFKVADFTKPFMSLGISIMIKVVKTFIKIFRCIHTPCLTVHSF